MEVISHLVKQPDPMAARTFERFALVFERSALVPPSVAPEHLFLRCPRRCSEAAGVRIGRPCARMLANWSMITRKVCRP
jgi:hypothetical protein